MLPKKNRADQKTVEEIFKKGKSAYSPIFTFRFIKSPGKETRISFIAPKSLAKLAVARNSLRRKGYNALSKAFPVLPQGLRGVFLFKKYEKDIEAIQHNIEEIARKIN